MIDDKTLDKWEKDAEIYKFVWGGEGFYAKRVFTLISFLRGGLKEIADLREALDKISKIRTEKTISSDRFGNPLLTKILPSYASEIASKALGRKEWN